MADSAPGGTLTLAGDLVISRMGFGAMQLAGPGVFGRSENPRSGQLHGTEAHAAEDEVIGEPEGAAGGLAGAGRGVSHAHISISNVAVVVTDTSTDDIQPQRWSWIDVECLAWRGIPRGRAGA